MAQTWPSGSTTASDIYFRTDIDKATLIPNIKWMLEAQFGPSRTMKWPEMAQTWPSGTTPATDIDFRTNIVKNNIDLQYKMDTWPSCRI